MSWRFRVGAVVSTRMGGAEVLGVIRAEHPKLPVIIASGYDQSDRHGAITPDARTRFLQKPFTSDGLARKVREVLDRRPTPRPV